MFLNGVEIQGTEIATHIFEFKDLPFELGKNKVDVKSGQVTDSCIFQGAEAPNPDYVLPQEDESENVDNWFGEVLEFPEGYYSIKDQMGELVSNEAALKAIADTIYEMIPDKNMADTTVRMFSGINAPITLEGVLRAAGNNFPPTARSAFNQNLIKIKKD